MAVDQELSALVSVASLLSTDIIYLVRDPGGVAEADNKAAVSVLDARFATAAQGALAATALQDAPINGSQYARLNGAWAVVSAGAALPVADTTAVVMGSVDNTKLLRFEVDGFTAGATRVMTPPNQDTTLAGQNFANVFTAAQKINVNSAVALFVEQDGVHDNAFVIDTADGIVGIGIAPSSLYKTYISDIMTLDAVNRRGLYINATHNLNSGSPRSYGAYVDMITSGTAGSTEIYGLRNETAVGNAGANAIAAGLRNALSITATQALTTGYAGFNSGRIVGTIAGSITTLVGLEVQLEASAGATTAVTSGFFIRASNFLSGATFTTLTGLSIPDVTQGGTNYAIRANAGLYVFNDGGNADSDVRFEGDTNTHLFFLDAGTENIGINDSTPDGKLDIVQNSTTAAIPVLQLEQLDVSEEFINFIAAVATGNPIEAIGAKTLTTTHFIRVAVNGAFLYFPVGTIA